MSTTYYELRCFYDAVHMPFSEGLGLVNDAIRYTTLRGANFAKRRAEKEPELIPAGGKLSVWKVTEEEINPDEKPQPKEDAE